MDGQADTDAATVAWALRIGDNPWDGDVTNAAIAKALTVLDVTTTDVLLVMLAVPGSKGARRDWRKGLRTGTLDGLAYDANAMRRRALRWASTLRDVSAHGGTALRWHLSLGYEAFDGWTERRHPDLEEYVAAGPLGWLAYPAGLSADEYRTFEATHADRSEAECTDWLRSLIALSGDAERLGGPGPAGAAGRLLVEQEVTQVARTRPDLIATLTAAMDAEGAAMDEIDRDA